jgi:hypothetical protein
MVHNVNYRRGTVESGVGHTKKTAPKETALRTLAAQSSINQMGKHWADNGLPGTTNARWNHIHPKKYVAMRPSNGALLRLQIPSADRGPSIPNWRPVYDSAPSRRSYLIATR